jgi:hypothetical protein
MKRAIVAVVVSLLTWAYSDVLIWQRIFEANQLYSYDWAYQRGHFAVLMGLIALGMIALASTRIWAAWYGAATITLAYSGLGDVLYYVLDGRSLPAAMPWLDEFHPLVIGHPVTGGSVVVSSAIWLVLWALSLAGLTRFRASRLRRPVWGKVT